MTRLRTGHNADDMREPQSVRKESSETDQGTEERNGGGSKAGGKVLQVRICEVVRHVPVRQARRLSRQSLSQPPNWGDTKRSVLHEGMLRMLGSVRSLCRTTAFVHVKI